MAMQPLVEAKGLRKVFPGGVHALDDIDLTVEAGENVGLIGANGSGKSTLLGVLAGRIRPDAGSVAVAGQAPGSRRARSRVGFASQYQSLDQDMTGLETIDFFADLNGLAGRERTRKDSLASGFGLAEQARARVSAYSGGMRQRLHLLLAFLHDPDLLLLDEPVHGLDPQSQEALWKLLRERVEKGKSTILSLHDLLQATAQCTRVAMMAAGSIRIVGAPRDLIAQHGARLWRAEFSAPPADAERLRARLAALPSVRDVDLDSESLSLWLAEDNLEATDFSDLLADAGCEVRCLRQQGPDLASVYRQSVGKTWPTRTREAERESRPKRRAR